ncbi:cytidine deaminase [Nakamurella flavida]|uniref:Cytidine deaminase n=1 Tax=Nakamurella flavida TaxID=363630 RepID=A0A938YM96_9ACTN|nr:cytidine deaminase [Nakamurella flavida]
MTLDAEDTKLVVLARGARGRAAAAEGAAVRDEDGRTYAAATVTLPSLQLTALQAAAAAALASGARRVEAAVIVGGAQSADPASRAVAADLSAPVLILADAQGTPLSRVAP